MPKMPDLFFMVAVILIIYFLIFLPKRKEQQAMARMLAEMKKGDKVLTHSGMIGEIVAIKDDLVTLKFHDNVKIDFAKSAISKSMEPKPADDKKPALEAKA